MSYEGQPAGVDVPMRVRSTLGHGYLGWLARQLGVDVLHIKGAAVHEKLDRGGRGGNDIDVLVRPRDVPRVMEHLGTSGWSMLTTFESGSIFQHAATLHHPAWGSLDLHRFYPGFRIDAEAAFEQLWGTRKEVVLGGQPCLVPGLLEQRLILLLHSSRTPQGATDLDVETNWNRLDAGEREAILSLARRFDAEVALAAVTGDTERHRDDPELRLWATAMTGSGPVAGWIARLRAAHSARQKWVTAVSIIRPNVDHLRLRYGHEPTRAEIWQYYQERIRDAVSEVRGYVKGKLS